jgi:uncharacterized membrane protein YoaK (UPF0700 family)
MNGSSRLTLVALLGLTFVTGLVDAASVLGLGHVFVANMTGNVVFIGFAAVGQGNSSLSAGALALGCFLVGALFGGRITSLDAQGGARKGFALELAILLVASGVSLLDHGEYQLHGLIAMLALAMGLRNALVRKLAVTDMTTTVLTLTLTGIAADSSLAGGSNPRLARRLASVAAMLLGAATGAVLLRTASSWPVVAAGLIEATAVLLLVRELGAGAPAPVAPRDR